MVLRCHDAYQDHRGEEKCAAIDLDSTYEQLQEHVKAAAAEMRRRANNVLLMLKEKGYGVTMRANQTFGAGNTRTLHMQSFPRRFASVRDMFTTEGIADAIKHSHDMVLTIDMEIWQSNLEGAMSSLSTKETEIPWLAVPSHWHGSHSHSWRASRAERYVRSLIPDRSRPDAAQKTTMCPREKAQRHRHR